MTELKPIPRYKVGDSVTRMLAGTVPMILTVTEVHDDYLICGYKGGIGDPDVLREGNTGWKFDRTYGYEIDEDLGWGITMPDGSITTTGSYLVEEGHGETV